MPQSLRLVARAAGWTLGLYALLWLVASIWAGGRADTLDTNRALTDIYKSDVREFVYRLPAFCEAAKGRRNLIFVGGSTASAYDPQYISPATEGWAVSRIALDFANITQMRQTVALLRQCMDKETFARSRIVLGVSYVSMAKNSNRFPTPYTMLELEQKRHGMFAGDPGKLAPAVGWDRMGWAVDLGRPVILAHYAVTGVTDLLGEARKQFGKLRQGKAVPPSPADRAAEELRFNDSLIGEVPGPAFDEQGREFALLVAEIRAAGSDIYVVAIPEQAFVRAHAQHIGAYYGWLAAFARARHVTVLRHPHADGDFRDGIHATPAGSAKWSTALGPILAGSLPTR